MLRFAALSGLVSGLFVRDIEFHATCEVSCDENSQISSWKNPLNPELCQVYSPLSHIGVSWSLRACFAQPPFSLDATLLEEGSSVG